MDALPASLADLPAAVHLDFSNNGLTTLPPELSRLPSKRLLTFNVKKNPFEDRRFSAGMAPKAFLQIIKKKPKKSVGGKKGADNGDESERLAAVADLERRQAARRGVEEKKATNRSAANGRTLRPQARREDARWKRQPPAWKKKKEKKD